MATKKDAPQEKAAEPSAPAVLEYPKWVEGVIVQNADEEKAVLGTAKKAKE